MNKKQKKSRLKKLNAQKKLYRKTEFWNQKQKDQHDLSNDTAEFYGDNNDG